MLWGHLGWASPAVSHLRLGFYTSDTFSPDPTMDRDVAPILAALRKIQPDIVTGGPRARSLSASALQNRSVITGMDVPAATRFKSPGACRQFLSRCRPQVTVALDPEASGPDTHYKVLQAVTAGLQQYADEAKQPNIQVSLR